jgi:hypothetical protein
MWHAGTLVGYKKKTSSVSGQLYALTVIMVPRLISHVDSTQLCPGLE